MATINGPPLSDTDMDAIGISVVFEPESSIVPTVDIVFVHGFTGHPYRTWAAKSTNERREPPEPKRRKLFGDGGSQKRLETYWPRDFLPTTVPTARILTFGYDTRIRHKLGSQGSKNTVYDHAKELLHSLNDYRQDKDDSKRPILFIVHSLGGIVVKEALRQSHRLGGSYRQQSLHLICEHAIGVIFFGTPHRGADPRGPLQYMVQKVIEALGVEANKQIVNTLMPDSERLKELLEDFPPLAREKKWAIYSFQEQYGVTALSGKKVVEDVSSCIGDPGMEITRGIESNHMDMCRFSKSDDAQYRKVESAIRQILREHKTRSNKLDNSTPPWSSEKYPIDDYESGDSPSELEPSLSESRTSSERGYKVSVEQRQHLVSCLEFDEIDARFANLKTPKAKTCIWMLQTSQYKAWKDNKKQAEHRGFFWIKGKPGSGKSIMMKYLFSKAKSVIRGAKVISFFFNARGARLERSTLGLYRSLLFQLLGSDMQLQDHVFSILGYQAAKHIDPDNWRVSTLKNMMSKAIESLPGRSLVCYIDALDECPEDEIRDMISFFEDVGEQAIETGVRLNICFSSRHYPHITVKRGLQIILEDEVDHTTDIRTLVDSELRIGGRENDVADIKDQIVTKASGVFLWVALVIPLLNEAFDRGMMKGMKSKLMELPQELSDLFKGILLRDSRNRAAMLLCLQWVLFAKAPMGLEELYFAVGAEDSDDAAFLWDKLETTEETMRRSLLDISKGLVEETKSKKSRTMQFIHESVRDFLLKEKGLQQLWPDLSKDFEGQSHCCLANRCLKQLDKALVGELEIPNPLPKKVGEFQKLRERVGQAFPFLSYAVNHVLYHTDTAQTLGISQSQFLEQFPMSTWVACHNLTEKHITRRYPPNINMLYVLAEQDLVGLVQIHPDHLKHLNIEGGRYRLPLFAALACGCRQVSRYLGWQVFLDQGVQISDKISNASHEQFFNTLQPNMQFEARKKSLLTALAELDCAAALESLCVLGEDPNKADMLGRYPLSCVQSPETAEALLLHGASPTCFIGQFDTIQAPIHDRLLKYGISLTTDAEKWNFLNSAARVGCLNAFECAIEKWSCDIFYIRHGSEQILLSYIVQSYSKTMTKFLLAQECLDLDSRDRQGRTPLSYAGQSRSENLRLLLKTGRVNLDSVDDTGRTPLSYAAGSNINSVRFLLETGKVNPDSVDNIGRTPFSYAAESNIDIVRLLLETGKINPDSVDNIGRTPLSYAASHNAASLPLLLRISKINPDSIDNIGRTPFSYAAGFNTNSGRLFLETGKINPDFLDNKGKGTYLPGSSFENMRLFLETGKINPDSVDKMGRTPLSYAATHNAVSIPLLLKISKINPDSVDNIGRTPLSYAAEFNTNIVRLLLKTGKVDPDSIDNIGRTPLSYAIDANIRHSVELFLEIPGVNLNSRDNTGKTPFLQASSMGWPSMISLFLNDKIDLKAKDNQNKNALRLLMDRGFHGSALILDNTTRLLGTGQVDPLSKADDDRTPLDEAESLMKRRSGDKIMAECVQAMKDYAYLGKVPATTPKA